MKKYVSTLKDRIEAGGTKGNVHSDDKSNEFDIQRAQSHLK